MSDDTTDQACATCGDTLEPDERAMSCSECLGQYHLGQCSGISEVTFKTKGEEYKKSWRCPQCRKPKSAPVCSKENEQSFFDLLLDIRGKLDELMPLKQTVGDIEASIKLMSEKYDKVLVDIAKHDGEIKSLKSRVSKLEKSNSEHDLSKVSTAVNELEYHSRKLNIEIHGIKQTKDESLMSKVNEIASKLSLQPINEQSITAIHRLPSKADKIPGIIVRFVNQATRDRWLDKRKVLQSVAPGHFISENLTARNRALLKLAKDWTSENGYRFAWHRNGKVLVKKDEGCRALRIMCSTDLDKL